MSSVGISSVDLVMKKLEYWMIVMIFFIFFSTDQNKFLTLKEHKKRLIFSVLMNKKLQNQKKYSICYIQFGQCGAKDTSFVCFNH